MMSKAPLLESPATVETALVPQRDQTAALVLMFERLAKDPAVDVDKLERLIQMQERILAHNAKSAFDAAFAAMQPAIPSIDEKGRIMVEGQLRSTYAKNEDIQDVIRPILARHGFSLGFETLWPEAGGIELVGTLSHVGGHARQSRFKSGADDSGKKNRIQALGSAISYGHRYVTIDLLNITTREVARGADDDGETSQAPPEPDGLSALWESLQDASMESSKAFYAVWNKAPVPLRNYIMKHQRSRFNDMRDVAQKAGA